MAQRTSEVLPNRVQKATAPKGQSSPPLRFPPSVTTLPPMPHTIFMDEIFTPTLYRRSIYVHDSTTHDPP